MQLGWTELLIVLILLILLVGSDRLIKAGRELGKSLRSLQTDSEKSKVAKLVSETETPLKVFVSSVIVELAEERKEVARSIRTIPITRPWVFEQSPSSGDPVVKTYLNQVRQADIFVLLIGKKVSSPVIKEYKTAVDAKKLILVFIKSGEKDGSAKKFIKSLNVKWSEFSNTEELSILVQSSIGIELIKRFRHYNLSTTELSALIVFSGDMINRYPTLQDKDANLLIGRWEIRTSLFASLIKTKGLEVINSERFDLKILDFKENGTISGTQRNLGLTETNLLGKIVSRSLVSVPEEDEHYHVSGSWSLKSNIVHMNIVGYSSGEYYGYITEGAIIGASLHSSVSHILTGVKI